MNRSLIYFVMHLRLTRVTVLLMSIATGLLFGWWDMDQREKKSLLLLETQAQRSSLELMSQTLNGNLMGSITLLGLIDRDIKQEATNGLLNIEASIGSTLSTLGNSFNAEGVFVVGEDGIVKTSWDRVNKPSTGLNVKFRPYFQMAMRGQTSVYAAVSMARGDRALYFSAPIYAERAKSISGTGALVARTDLSYLDTLIKGKFDVALLLSPQGVVFASSKDEWVGLIDGVPDAKRLKAIRELKQFGAMFEQNEPKVLPITATTGLQSVYGSRYAVAFANVKWNDPSGDWKLVVLNDLTLTEPFMPSLIKGMGVTVLALLLGSMMLHLLRASYAQLQSHEQLKDFAKQQETTVEQQIQMAKISANLQHALSWAEFANTFMFNAVPLLHFDYAEFYVLDATRQRLTPVGGYAAKLADLTEWDIGQGMVGQCAKSETTIVISRSPETRAQIDCGFGSIKPESIMMLPLVHTGTLLGVIVLASMQAMHKEKRALLDMMLPMVAMSLQILNRNLETQHQTAVLRETETWYRGIIDSVSDSMLVVDEGGLILLANPQVEVLFDYASGELIGSSIFDLIPALVPVQDAEKPNSLELGSAAQTTGNLGQKLHGVSKSSREFLVACKFVRLPAQVGRENCVCITVRAITERKLAEVEI